LSKQLELSCTDISNDLVEPLDAYTKAWQEE